MTSQSCKGFVVVVDDEEDARELLRDLFEDRGYQVATAEDGVAALELLPELPSVCVMIVDLLMPRMGGVELLSRLSSPKFKVFVSTSAPDRAPPGVPCLPKPVDVQQLIALVDEHCAGEACART